MLNSDYSNPRLMRVSFLGNDAGDCTGGGMENFRSSPILIDAPFRDNTARHGAGMEGYQSSGTLINVNFINNRAASPGAAR